MDRESARISLLSDVNDERLRAARALVSVATEDDLALLIDSESKETVRWIKRALNLAIERLGGPTGIRINSEDVSEGALADLTAEQIYQTALMEASENIVHELAGIVGSIVLTVKKELGDRYESTETSVQIGILQRTIEGLRNLSMAAAVPTYTDFNIYEVVQGLLGLVACDSEAEVEILGARELVVNGDQGQLILAVKNGLANAMEAVKEVPGPRIVVNWGRSGREFYLVIKDNGGGFTASPDTMRLRGQSTKSGHIGYGLTLAETAMRSMDGELRIDNDGPGAHFELRWFRDNENFAG